MSNRTESSADVNLNSQALDALVHIAWMVAKYAPNSPALRLFPEIKDRLLEHERPPEALEFLTTARRISRKQPLPCIGTRVRSLCAFAGIPAGTEGVIDEHYRIGGEPGVMVAWDLPGRELPPEYGLTEGFAPPAAFSRGAPLRDGFSAGELKHLEIVEEP